MLRFKRKRLPVKADHKHIAQLEHELGLDDCQYADAPCAQRIPQPPPHLRERLPGGYWIHLSQCWCRSTVDVTSINDPHTVLAAFDADRYKNHPTRWTENET